MLYPPVVGSESEATENLYLESGYAASAISDTNNPLVTIRQKLEAHFGQAQGGANLVVFIHTDQVAKIEALGDFEALDDNFVRAGADSAMLVNLPNVPGRIIGRCNGVWVVEWAWITTAYLLGIHLEAPAPILERVDPAETGLGQGLQLVSTNNLYPLTVAQYRFRFGMGVGNRLNGVVMELGTGGTYSIPADFQ